MNTPVTRQGPLRIHQTGDSLHLVADVTPASYVGAFAVNLSGMNVRLGAGTVNQVAPTVGGVPLDGVANVTIPIDTPNANLRSWVCLKVSVDLKTGQPKKDQDAITVVHTNDVSWLVNGFSKDDGKGNGLWPLSMIVWQSKTSPQRVVRNVYSNLTHTYQPGTAPLPGNPSGWHIFTPIR